MSRKPSSLATLTLALVMVLGSTAGASPASYRSLNCNDDVSQADVSNKKKMLKTFTAEFWRTIEKKIATYPKPLQRKGVVVGDFHFSNLGVYWNYKSGTAELTVNDLDDGGTNYLIGDLMKYMVYLHKVNKKLDLATVLDSYLKGLQKNLSKKPSELAEILNWKSEKFDKKRMKYVVNRREDAKKLPVENLTNEQKVIFTALERQPIFQQLSDVERYLQTNDSGSSAGMDRYVFFGTSKETGAEGIIEFKSLKCAASGAKDRQDLIEDRRIVVDYLSKVRGVKASETFLGRQHIVQVEGEFLLSREKVPNPINDIGIEELKGKELEDYAQFYASYLGFIHSGSADASYIQAISSNKDMILGQLKPIFSEFKKNAENEN